MGCILSIINILHDKQKHKYTENNILQNQKYIIINSNTKIMIGNFIDSGGYANVYECTINNNKYAIKILKSNKLDNIEYLLNEYQLFSRQFNYGQRVYIGPRFYGIFGEPRDAAAALCRALGTHDLDCLIVQP